MIIMQRDAGSILLPSKPSLLRVWFVGLCVTVVAASDPPSRLLAGQHFKVFISGCQEGSAICGLGSGNGNDAYTGLAPQSLEAVAQVLGFTYTIQSVGYIVDASSLKSSGILADSKSIWWSKSFIVEYLYSGPKQGCASCGYGVLANIIYEDTFTLLTTKHSSPSDPWSFLRPFSLGVWMMLLLAGFVFATLLFLVELQASEGELDASIGGFYRSLQFAFSSFFGFGDFSPQTPLGRLLVCGWALLCLIMTATYTANLAAFLTAQDLAIHVPNLATAKLSTVCTSQAFEEQLHVLQDNGLVGSTKLASPKTTHECINQLRAGTVDAVLVPRHLAVNHHNNNCDLANLDLGFAPVGAEAVVYNIPARYAAMVNASHPNSLDLHSALKKAIMHLQDAGVLQTIWREVYTSSCRESSSLSEQIEVAELHGLFGIYYGLAGLIVLLGLVKLAIVHTGGWPRVAAILGHAECHTALKACTHCKESEQEEELESNMAKGVLMPDNTLLPEKIMRMEADLIMIRESLMGTNENSSDKTASSRLKSPVPDQSRHQHLVHIFDRYDLEATGYIYSTEDLNQMLVNCATKFKIPVNQNVIEAIVNLQTPQLSRPGLCFSAFEDLVNTLFPPSYD